MIRIIKLSFWATHMILAVGCQRGPQAVQIDLDGPPAPLLSDYNFFRGNLQELQPNTRVLPYDLNTPLFTDYAHKARFVWIPEGVSAIYTSEGVLEFPEGAVLIKNFFFVADESDAKSDRRIIETRLLVNRPAGWEAHSYVWNEMQTEAALDIVGGIEDVDWLDSEGNAQHANYIIPNKNQCKSCHAYDNTLQPIGPKARNLNKDYNYAEGSQNQLARWEEMGFLTGYDPAQMQPRTVVWDDTSDGTLHERALAYLDMNCGHCHNPHGAGGTTGLNLVHDAPTDLNLGIYKPPVAAGRASGSLQYSIVPGKAEESILLYRMESTEPGVMMPEVGRTLAHQEGIDLIRNWINSME